MAVGRAADTLYSPGRLVVDPTSFAGSFPYGGTAIGRHVELRIFSFGNPVRIESEGLGEASDILYPTNEHVATFGLRGFDDDAVELLFAGNYQAGATTGHSVINIPGSASPGQSMLANAVGLLFVPDDTNRNPAVMVYRGAPYLPDGAEIPLQRSREFLLPVGVQCLRNAAGNTIEVGRIADLTSP